MQTSRMKRTHALKKGRPGTKAWRKKQHQPQAVSVQSGKRRHKSKNTVSAHELNDHTTEERVVYRRGVRVRLLKANYDRRKREGRNRG